jgi:hypothetical protein
MFLTISVCGEFSLSIISGATALGLAGVILASISILKVKSIMIAVSSVLLAISAMLFVLISSHKVLGIVSASPLILGVLFVLWRIKQSAPNQSPEPTPPSGVAHL